MQNVAKLSTWAMPMYTLTKDAAPVSSTSNTDKDI